MNKLLVALLIVLSTAGSSAQELSKSNPIRVSLAGNVAVVVHRNGQTDMVPCATLNIGRKAYLEKAQLLVKGATTHVGNHALALELQVVRPRIAAYNKVALLCERAGEMPADAATDSLARRLNQAIQRYDERVSRRGSA